MTATDPTTEIAIDVETVQVLPGDTVVVRLPDDLDGDHLVAAAESVKARFPDNLVLVLLGEVDLAAMRPSPMVAAVTFHERFDLAMRDEPQVDDIFPPERRLRVRLLLEEVAELICAIHGLPDPAQLAAFFGSAVVSHLDRTGRDQAHEPFDIVELAREMADVIAVVYGTALHYGVDVDAAYAEVMAAGMRKLDADGRPVKRDDGKVLKPEGWQPPNVARAIGVEQRATTEGGTDA